MRTRTCTTFAVLVNIPATSIVGTVLRARTTAVANASLSHQVSCETLVTRTFLQIPSSIVVVRFPGNYLPVDGDNTYLACQYSTHTGAATCGSPGGGCSPGYYYTGSACALVPAGYFSPNASSGVYYYCQYSNAPGSSVCSPALTVSVMAGSGNPLGIIDGTYSSANLDYPLGLAVDTYGNVYVAQGDSLEGVRKISALGVVTTLAGNPTSCARNWYDVCVDGQGTVATFGRTQAIAVDANLNVYVADYNKHNVRMITSSGYVKTMAGSMSWAAGSVDGQGTAARFNTPIQIAVDRNAYIYISDRNNCKLRKISPSGVVSTFAGSGVCSTVDDVGTRATFYYPMGLAVDSQGNVYVATQACRLRLVTPSGLVRTLAGTGSQSVSASDGFGTSAGFDFGRSYQLAIDVNSNIYLASTYNIRKMTSSGAVTTMWYHSTSSFHYGVAVDSSSNVYVSEYGAGRVFKISQAGEGRERRAVGYSCNLMVCCVCFVLSHQVPRVLRVITSRTPPLA